MLFQQAYDKFENDKFKQALKTLTLDNLPLSVCCRHSGDIDKGSVEITILSSAESENIIQLKTGVFFRNWQATNQGWSEISTISTKEPSIERPEIFNPAFSILSIKLLLTS
jgi:hypothetical protein